MLRSLKTLFLVLIVSGLNNLYAEEFNLVPNPDFEGTHGIVLGSVSGAAPDYWRAFGLEGGEISIETVPLAANTLYTGSPATNAVKLTIVSFGAAQAFDHENTLFSLVPDFDYTASVYMRSANAGGESQGVSVAFPIFDANGYTGRAPGSFNTSVTSEWARYSGPSFTESGDTAADIAFRLNDDGGDNSILIAMPVVGGPPPDTPEVSYPPIFTGGRDFSDTDRYVSTMVFHWYSRFAGQADGPWLPLEGRENWTGDAAWWREQIKDMMDANIEVLYVHLFNGFGYQREEFFKALSKLRREGYDTPYVLPFLDPLIIWFNNPIDMTQESAKDEYVGWYELWFEQYFRQNTDKHAESRLMHINGSVVLNTWHGNPGTTNNLSALTRNDVESRLAEAFGSQYPSFNNGIYQIATSNGFAPSFTDEKAHQFSNTEYYSTNVFNGRRPATMKGGYWDQNIRDPGSFLARNGGTPYAVGWDDLNAARDGGDGQLPIYHAYIESWNEYDEGTGIFAADSGPPYVAPENQSGNDDTWSNTDNPREYIDTTHAGASEFNDHPDLDSQFLWNSFPPSLTPGESIEVQVLVRNAGNVKWSGASGIQLAQTDSDAYNWGPELQSIDAGPNEVEKYGGVFRGRPVLFTFTITAPLEPGVYQAHYQMLRNQAGEELFGEVLALQITVGNGQVEPGHSAAFFNPLRNGEGNYVEILSNSQAVVYTFTYRPDGSGPAWFIGVGEIDGDSILIDDLLRPTGTEFGPGFESSEIVFSPGGTMSMSFLDCDSSAKEGSVVFSGEVDSGYSPLLTRASRISQITGCSSTPVANAGLSGSFYDPARNGEGLVIQWLTTGQVVVIMFTYDLKGDQFWTFGIGTPNGTSVTIETLYPSSSTSWGSGFDPDEVVLSPWGTINLSWTSCDSVTFDYESLLPGFGSASRAYTRISNLAETQCPEFP